MTNIVIAFEHLEVLHFPITQVISIVGALVAVLGVGIIPMGHLA